VPAIGRRSLEATYEKKQKLRREGGGVEERRPNALERLREEITVLRIEGTLFCFDPKEAKRRDGTITNLLKDAEGNERPVKVNPSGYGQPSVGYKLASNFFEDDRRGRPYQEWLLQST
jgi:hypothetical protein